MDDIIKKIGGNEKANEVIRYHQEYFKAYPYFNLTRKKFEKSNTNTRVQYVIMDELINHMRKTS